ncbi:MAG: GNAT family N-acetyltransferase [Bacillota bacterium]|nr:GNAT family N-acetyltransferase [Bacillota bacterium]
MNIIETNRLVLRGWKVEDYLDMYEINSDEKVNPSAGCVVVKDIEKIKDSLNLLIPQNQSYAIVLKRENKVIGTIGMDEIAPDESLENLKQRYIGYRLNSNYWGKGYATEAAQSFIKYLFDNFNLDLIWSSHYNFNVRSKRVIEKCGFHYKFNRSKTVKALGNRILTELFYSLTKNEYIKLKI